MAIPLKVTIFRGSDLVGEQRFDRDIIKIGRLASAHLKLDDLSVSRIHAVIEVSSDGQDLSIIDMGSSDGTFVNGERISKEKPRRRRGEGRRLPLGTKFRGHVGNGYRVPSLYERFGSFFNTFPSNAFVAIGDPFLKPERPLRLTRVSSKIWRKTGSAYRARIFGHG